MTTMPCESSPHGRSGKGCNQAKRAACDRCRGQKLRCLMENQSRGSRSGNCIRCNTAGAVCSFSFSKRVGRPPAATNSTNRRARVRFGQSGQSASREGLLGSVVSTFDNVAENQGRNTIDDEMERQAGHTASTDDFVVDTDQGCMHDPAWEALPNLPWPETLDDGGNSKLLESLGSDYNWSFTNTLSAGQLDENQADHLINNSLPTQLHDRISMPSPLQHGLGTSDPPFGMYKHESKDQSIDVNTMSCPTGPRSLADIGDDAPTAPSRSNDDIQHQRMHKLSELAMNLYSQIAANEEYDQVRISTGSPGLRQQLVGNILRSSAGFLTLLKSFYPLLSLSARPTSSTTSNVSFFDSTSHREVSPSNTSVFSDFGNDFATSTTSIHPPPQHQWKQQQQQQRTTSTSTTTSNHIPEDTKPVTADMTTIFQLLTCYIRIAHLHSMFYAQVHTFLTASTPKTTSLLPPLFPGMAVGDLPLDSFRDFQVKLLLQISTHVLGEIEMMLGLPEGYRISKRRDWGPKGILETSVSVQFVEMTMRENGRTGWGVERERVRCIRDILGRLRALLRGTINI